MREHLESFIRNNSFPCIMAKSVLSKGFLSYNVVKDVEEKESVLQVKNKLYSFIDKYRSSSSKLSSFVLSIEDERYKNFEYFEKVFWNFLRNINLEDKKLYSHDPRVASDPKSETFSFSLKEEAFFILVLHPESPRLARRFSYPTIVFNPHQQFEDLRAKGLFKKIRDLIRKKDELLQGYINPMVEDFGAQSEVFQYLGKKYELNSPCPL